MLSLVVPATAAAFALLLGGCADGIAPFAPPVTITYSLRLGEEVVCTDTVIRLALPNAVSQVFGWAKRHWTCELRLKLTSPADMMHK